MSCLPKKTGRKKIGRVPAERFNDQGGLLNDPIQDDKKAFYLI